MAACTSLLRSSFPSLDDELIHYIDGVLTGGVEEFTSADEVYDAIGGHLQAVAGDERDDDIRHLCEQIMGIMMNEAQGKSNSPAKLSTPVYLSQVNDLGDRDDETIVTIANATKEPINRIDHQKLHKAETKLKNKLVKRTERKDESKPAKCILDSGPSVTQAISRKETRLEAKGIFNSKDIRLDNFDVAYGDKSLIRGTDLILVAGRRYGLVGRNGLGKTTLLKALASGHLLIPSHITILHVEQEVDGDDTEALQSVLQSDSKRESLLHEEKTLVARLNAGGDDVPISQARLAEVYAELQLIEADKAPAVASVILSGLGFSSEMQVQKTREFSGGWRMRIALARALFSKPDLLLLDEPTNMLDMKAIIWLQTYLQSWPTTLLVVSHDRQFLEVVPTDILHLHSQRVETYKGNYSTFVKVMTEKLKNMKREYEAQQQFRAHVQVFIDRFRYNANRAALVQSKIKMLEKLPELKPVEKEGEAKLQFPIVEALSPPILMLDEVEFYYVSGKSIFSNICVSANMESRICIVGDNGAGKSTLLKILLGDLSVVRGVRFGHRNLRLGYFSQHHVDQLTMNVTPVELLQQRCPGKHIEEYRRQLGSFGISGDLALQPIELLSGGQKSRVAFAAMCINNPNFLILDEPTNHLDVETIEALGKAINKYTGGVILVSHDERLIRMVCRELWVCGNKEVISLEGGFDEYRRIVQKELELQCRSK